MLSCTQSLNLKLYVDLLMQWNKTHNLTAWKNPSFIVEQLAASLATIAPLLPPSNNNTKVLDLGTGAGIPGITLAIMRPDMHYLLIDSRIKKIAFVRHAIRQLQLKQVETACMRVEDYQQQKFNLVVARAFGSVECITRLTSRLLTSRAQYLLERGGITEDELKWCKKNFNNVTCHQLQPPANGLLLSIETCS